MNGHGLRRTGNEELGDQRDDYGNHKQIATSSNETNNSKTFPIHSTNEVQQQPVRPPTYPTLYVHADDPRYPYYKSGAYDKRRDNAMYSKQDNVSQYNEYQRSDNRHQHFHNKKIKGYPLRSYHPYHNNNKTRQHQYPSELHQSYYKNPVHHHSHRHIPQYYQHEQEPYEVAINRYKKDIEYRQHEQEQEQQQQQQCSSLLPQYMPHQKYCSCSLKHNVNKKTSGDLINIKDIVKHLLVNTSLVNILKNMVEQYSEMEKTESCCANRINVNDNEKDDKSDAVVIQREKIW